MHTHSEIWEKFVEFEAGVGDLPSLLKVERRRAAALKGEVSHTPAAPFSDLTPTEYRGIAEA